MPDRASIPHTARPWTSRLAGECAYPVDGCGEAMRCCCAPCGEARYCEPHRRAMRPGRPLPIEVLIAELRALGLCD
ncbi:MAG TPA: hypothetical protein VIC25_04995 [Caulobacteraceae bacterium]